jgi:calcium-dependent protein kinase
MEMERSDEERTCARQTSCSMSVILTASSCCSPSPQITITELSRAMEKAGTTARKEELLQLLKSADIDGDGSLSYEELLMTSVGRKISAKEERLWNAFSKVDLNHDGKLSASEIQKVLGGDEAEVKAMIAEVDADGDGEIDFDGQCICTRSRALPAI